MRVPHLHCVLEDTGETLFQINSSDYNLRVDDVIEYNDIQYKVESAVFKVESHEGPANNPSPWITLELLVSVSLII